MKFIGADIRVLTISIQKAVDLVRDFIALERLHKDKDQALDDNVIHIRASNLNQTFFNFWWKEIPQIIDWKIIELAADKTQIETRFGLHTKYRFYVWGIMLGLVTSLVFFYEQGKGVHLARSSRELVTIINDSTLNGIIILFLALIWIVFTAKSLMVYDGFTIFFKSFKDFIQNKVPLFSENIIQSNCTASHTWEFLIFIFSAFAVFIGVNAQVFLSASILRMQIGAAVAITLLLTLLMLILFFKKNIDFAARFTFGVVALSVALPLLFFYSLPFINAYTGNLFQLYEQAMKVEGLLKGQPNPESALEDLMNFKQVLGTYFLFAAFGNLTIISMGVGFFFCAPKIVRQVKGWNKDLFSSKSWNLYQRGVVDSSQYAKEFSWGVFSLWFLFALVFYVQIYTILSLIEFIIFGKNIFLEMSIARTFGRETQAVVLFFFAPLIGQTLADLFSRVILLAYSLPLLWLLYRVVVSGHGKDTK